jgi:hypothetical protein
MNNGSKTLGTPNIIPQILLEEEGFSGKSRSRTQAQPHSMHHLCGDHQHGLHQLYQLAKPVS